MSACVGKLVVIGDLLKTVRTLTIIAEILCGDRRWHDAGAVLDAAAVLAARNRYEKTNAIFAAGIAQCAKLGYRDVDGATSRDRIAALKAYLGSLS
ncbi:MAG TPA: hypothetical protein VJZ76_10875 [Thermoanaerobaculia bacterium]|nr:hypothetical protein [Thermoanaerobaculia bacterium]